MDAPCLAGDAVTLVEGLSFRGPLDHALADEDRWLLGGLAEVFDIAPARADTAADPTQSVRLPLMPLHERETVRDKARRPGVRRNDIATALPKYRFPDDGDRPGRRVPGRRPTSCMLDGNARQNLATFCQTWEEPAGPRS